MRIAWFYGRGGGGPESSNDFLTRIGSFDYILQIVYLPLPPPPCSGSFRLIDMKCNSCSMKWKTQNYDLTQVSMNDINDKF